MFLFERSTAITRREFAPYVGVLWRQNFGETKTLHQLLGPERQGFSVIFGLRMWR